MYIRLKIFWKLVIFTFIFMMLFQVYTKMKTFVEMEIRSNVYAVLKSNGTNVKNMASQKKKEQWQTKWTHNKNELLDIKESDLKFQPEDDDKSFNYVHIVNKIRRSRIRQTCNAQRKVIDPHQRQRSKIRMVMNQKHDITYCRVNKVASTYTMDLLTRLFKCSEDRLRGYAHEVEELPYSEMRRVVAKSFKFTFVREPYGRLFSTYSNKFYFPKEHWAPIGPLIVKRYRTNPSKDSLTYGHNITFAEMIRFLVDEFEAGRKVDEHLRPMNHRCNPCDYDYDFIGKLETLDADWNYLKQYWLKIKKISEIPEPAPKTGTSAFPDLKHILLTHTVIKDSTISKYKLYLRAWTYYQMTGYIYKYIDMPFNPSSQIKFKDFQTALEVAAERSKPYMTQTKQQKMEAIKQAYGSLPYPLLTRLRKVVDLDCKLFDYDCKPDWIFKMNDQKTDFDYFRGLN